MSTTSFLQWPALSMRNGPGRGHLKYDNPSGQRAASSVRRDSRWHLWSAGWRCRTQKLLRQLSHWNGMRLVCLQPLVLQRCFVRFVITKSWHPLLMCLSTCELSSSPNFPFIMNFSHNGHCGRRLSLSTTSLQRCSLGMWCSPQNMFLQCSHLIGKKSNFRQVISAQCLPMAMQSKSSEFAII